MTDTLKKAEKCVRTWIEIDGAGQRASADKEE